MRIGLSYSRCLRDIIDGNVDFDDVLVIIARTDFNPHNDEQWTQIWSGYHDSHGFSFSEWSSYSAEDESKFRHLSILLYDSGKLHQPRQFGVSPTRRPEIWLEAVLPHEELENNPMAKKAWEEFQIIAGLTNTLPNKEYKA